MRFLVDVCAGKELVDWLREQGHDVKEVREYNPRMNDDEILDWAKAEGRVIVTMDKDFGELAVVQRKNPLRHCPTTRCSGFNSQKVDGASYRQARGRPCKGGYRYRNS
jgi:predicted nuclease of predicted toxin-antitoxin system